MALKLILICKEPLMEIRSTRRIWEFVQESLKYSDITIEKMTRPTRVIVTIKEPKKVKGLAYSIKNLKSVSVEVKEIN